MRETILANWIALLHTEKITQIRKHLGHIDGGRCILGTLCDMAVEQGVILPPTPAPVAPGTDQEYLKGRLKYGNETIVLPAEVCNWAGLKSQDPRIGKPVKAKPPFAHTTDSLLSLNDSGLSLQEIAHLIEEHGIS